MDDPLQVVFALTFPLLIGAAIVVAALLWRGSGLRAPDVLAAPIENDPGRHLLGDIRIVTVWLLLSAVTVVGLFILGFAFVHALLFAFGTSVASIAAVVGVVALAAVPVAWGFVIHRHLRGGGS